MNRDVQKNILARLVALEKWAPRVRRGEVTDVSPLTVSLGGGEPQADVKSIAAGLRVGDQVVVLAFAGDMLVLGRIGGTVRIVSGTVAADGSESSPEFSVTKNGTGDYSVTFTTAFTSAPDVVSGVGGSGFAYDVKIYSGTTPTTTGFRIATLVAGTGSLTDGAFVFIAAGR